MLYIMLKSITETDAKTIHTLESDCLNNHASGLENLRSEC
jgi:hypothetical protein